MAAIHFRDMDVSELASWMNEKRDFTLLDVRLDSEYQRAAIPGSLHIPMKDVQARVREIPRGRPVVVVCHFGDRSSRIAQFLITDGFDEVFNLDGGIDAYALHVDSTVGRY